INARDSLGLTPLNWACLRGDRAGVELLLQWNADPNITDLNGKSPIHQATDHGHAAIARCLILCNVAPEVLNQGNVWEETALHIAAFYGHVDNVIFLVEQGADLEAVDEVGETPIFKA
ncbi:ankyrin repeat-containing domain protein, partial [Ilyonectria sp. MPI-CAGE-AT-0026]